MLTEKAIESKIMLALEARQIGELDLIGTRLSSATNVVKGEDSGRPAVAVLQIAFRSNDAFSLPTANIPGSLTLSTLVEASKEDELHDSIFESLVSVFAEWHKNGEKFTNEVSTDDFYATELRLDGGGGKELDRSSRGYKLVETFNFTIRGVFRD